MESMALVPQAARTLVHKHCIFSWALLQFELSFTETNRASAEERERYVKLVELCVRGCVDGEMRKAAAAAKASATGEAGAITAAQPNGVKVPSVARSSSDSDSNDSESDSDSDSDEDEEERLADPLAGNEEEDTDPLMAPSKFTSEEHDNGAGKGSGGGKLLALLIEATKPRPDWLVDIETFIDGVVADAGAFSLATPTLRLPDQICSNVPLCEAAANPSRHVPPRSPLSDPPTPLAPLSSQRNNRVLAAPYHRAPHCHLSNCQQGRQALSGRARNGREPLPCGSGDGRRGESGGKVRYGYCKDACGAW